MDTARKGNNKERRSAEILAAQGWTVASRRHIGGAGDLLAVKANERPLLIEVKCTVGGPWVHFGPSDRAALIEEAKRAGAVPALAWWAPRARTHRLYEDWEFPGALAQAA